MSPSRQQHEEDKSKSYVFCYYVSGHGFGHATRVVQVASEILALPRRHTLYIISNAPQFIFSGAIARGAKYRHALIDAGVQQPLAYTVDRQLTIADLEKFLSCKREMLDREAAWLREVSADVVLSDAPFLPCAAAAEVGIPAVIVSNFTFDAVYDGLCEGDELDARIKELAEQVVADYKKCELLVRLPGYIPMPAFEGTQLYPNPRILRSRSLRTTNRRVSNRRTANRRTTGECITNGRIGSSANKHRANGNGQLSAVTRPRRRVIDVPLVVRKSKLSREVVFRNLGIPTEIFQTHKAILVSFGGQVLDRIEEWGSPLPDGWIAIVCGSRGVEGKPLPERFYKCPVDAYIPDLTNAADVVMGKLGYGTCSECIGHSKPLIYVPRPQFVEEHGLKSLMHAQGSCVEMPKDHFETGRWKEYILRASSMLGVCESPRKRLTHDGGCVAARVLETFLDDRSLVSRVDGVLFEGSVRS